MKASLKMPRFGTSMEEGTIVKWHKEVGDVFAANETLYEVETEKVTSEVPAPCSGKLLEVQAPVDTTVRVGEPVCIIETQ